MKKCLMNLARVSVLIALTTWIGCGLDDRPNSNAPKDPAPSPAAPETPASPKPVPPVSDDRPSMWVSWYLHDGWSIRHLNKDESNPKVYRADAPIVLPWRAPTEIRITLSELPIKIKTHPATLKVEPSFLPKKTDPRGLEIDPRFVHYEESENGIKNITFPLEGILRVIGSLDHVPAEQVGTVTLQFTQFEAPDQQLTISFQIMTPPTNITFTQRSLKEYEKDVRGVPHDYKYLENGSDKMSLAQVIEIQNLSSQMVSVDLPLRVKGKLWQRSLWTDPQYGPDAEATCSSYQKRVVDTIETLSTDFVLLPFDLDPSNHLNELMSKKFNTLNFKQREVMTFGLYVTPAKGYEQDFKNLLWNRSPKEFARVNPIQMVTYATACDFKCDAYNLKDSFRAQCKSVPENYRSLCETRMASCLPCTMYRPELKQDKCNECFQSEYRSGTFGSEKFESACLSGWKREPKKTEQGKKGTEVGAIVLELETDGIYANTYFMDQTKEENMVYGYMAFLKKMTVQDGEGAHYE